MKKFIALAATIATLALPFNFGVAYAAPGSADLRTSVHVGYLGAVINGQVCNDGDETVIQFTLNIDSTTNYDVTSMVVNPDPGSGGSTATDPGTVDPDTGIWTGLVANGECVVIIIYGDVTGSIGDNLGATVTVSDSILEGSTPNVDPNSSNDTGSLTPYAIAEIPDIAIQTRLLTEGEITVGSTVSYEVIYGNVGDGFIPQDEDMMSVVTFIVPDAASFDTIIDLDPGDVLSSNPGTCFNVGAPVNIGSGLAGMEGTVIICLLARSGDLAAHTSYSFQFDMIASEAFVSEGVSVYANATGPDLDTMNMQQALFNGDNPFDTMSDVNNLAELTYDNDELITYINRCPGQNATTADGTGCFRVSFNKLIWEPSFDVSDLVLSAGDITSFTKIDNYTWEVRISNIPLGQSATLTLTEGSVLDYSAVSSVQVLGENVIRYEVAGAGDTDGSVDGSAAGSLPETGTETQWPLGVILVLIGAGMVLSSKKITLQNLV